MTLIEGYRIQQKPANHRPHGVIGIFERAVVDSEEPFHVLDRYQKLIRPHIQGWRQEFAVYGIAPALTAGVKLGIFRTEADFHVFDKWLPTVLLCGGDDGSDQDDNDHSPNRNDRLLVGGKTVEEHKAEVKRLYVAFPPRTDEQVLEAQKADRDRREENRRKWNQEDIAAGKAPKPRPPVK